MIIRNINWIYWNIEFIEFNLHIYRVTDKNVWSHDRLNYTNQLYLFREIIKCIYIKSVMYKIIFYIYIYIKDNLLYTHI